MSTLEKAIIIAVKAHEGQTDKAGEPYILHPLRMMLRLSSTEDRITAVLHDVIEDSPISLDDLRAQNFPEKIIEALNHVTKIPEESYDDFIKRAATNPISRRVKLVDLEDNSNLARIKNPTDQDRKRIEKYRRAILMIKKFDESTKNDK